MFRPLRFASLFVVGLLCLAIFACQNGSNDGNTKDNGKKDGDKQGPQVETTIVLAIPGSVELPDYDPPRTPKLTVNGKEEKIEWGPDREITVKATHPANQDSMEIVYGFWTSNYSNTIRTKVLKLEKGKEHKLDFNTPDKGRKDLIKPIYYPTPQALAEEMCKLGNVGKNDIVYDIGCGDGRLVVTALQKFGAKKGVGIDINPELVKLCNENAKKAGVADRAFFRNEDALKMEDLSDATVVLLYVGEDFGKLLEPVLRKTLKSGARVVSHRFPLGDWKPDVRKDLTVKNNDNEDEGYELLLWNIK